MSQRHVQHPSIFIAQELVERGWSRERLAHSMTGDPRMNRLVLDIYFAVGPTAPGLQLGDDAARIAEALDIDVGFLRNLENAWVETQS